MKAVTLALVVCCLLMAEAARSRKEWSGGSGGGGGGLRRAASGVYHSLSSVFGEDNIKALYKFFSRSTERFVHGVDSLLDSLWRSWTDLLDALGLDSSTLSHYFSPSSVSGSPSRALLLLGAVFLAYWFVSLVVGGVMLVLRAVLGRYFWAARVLFFALSCLYVLQKFEGDPEKAVLPLLVIMGVYFMTGPVSAYWRRQGASTLEDKIDNLEAQVRLLNIRLSRVIDNLEHSADQ
ncbi:BRI3-binding protein [Pangasianodon hypophthalmus]|uniref:BRI3-binding protein n=1 Tax=Pangasianodon hypophthalmus TaxID=310915 RepID=UPI002308290D|nr:BRI3-binding protein [Pangasianodon hypophthalmus]